MSDIPTMVDTMNDLRSKRLVLQKQAEALETQEKKIKLDIITLLKGRADQKYSNDHMLVSINSKIKPVAESWPLIYAFAKANDAFDLFQRRLTETAVKARWEEGITIPGINKFPVDDLSITTA